MKRSDHSQGTDNVLRDLGFDDAEELSAKAALALKLNELIDHRGLSQTEAAAITGIGSRGQRGAGQAERARRRPRGAHQAPGARTGHRRPNGAATGPGTVCRATVATGSPARPADRRRATHAIQTRCTGCPGTQGQRGGRVAGAQGDRAAWCCHRCA